MKISHLHHTTQEDALQAIQGLFPGLLQGYGDQISDLQHSQDGNSISFSFRLRGSHIEGTVEVTEGLVIVEAELPLIARPFEKQISLAVSRKLHELLPSEPR